jgi:hypothetical protein
MRISNALTLSGDKLHYKPWLHYGTLNPDSGLPRSLTSLYMRLLGYQRDKEIIPCTLKVGRVSNPSRHMYNFLTGLFQEDFRLSDRSVCKSIDDDAYYIPDRSESHFAPTLRNIVEDIVRNAEKCHFQQYDKTGWNNLVYTPIISASLYLPTNLDIPTSGRLHDLHGS